MASRRQWIADLNFNQSPFDIHIYTWVCQMDTTEVGDKLIHNRVILVVNSAFVCWCTRVSNRVWNKCLIFEVSVRMFPPEEKCASPRCSWNQDAQSREGPFRPELGTITSHYFVD